MKPRKIYIGRKFHAMRNEYYYVIYDDNGCLMHSSYEANLAQYLLDLVEKSGVPISLLQFQG